ncbi:heme oxygenase 1 [Condylostylus longicornis]|uniref:heme oxygenase 1 n=1 Tax=Condylostylus longicornis TaxID=2530218 RepID=UPI00244DB8A6|nr:heme oxygenase 1 [Condylostylus longicornis]
MKQDLRNELFSKQMRLVTRDIHKISDHLVNAKLAFALSDDAVWAEGLLIFYEIFKFLEINAPPDILPPVFHRTKAFESDLNYYLGREWKNSYSIRKEVQEYLDHLEKIYRENPLNLIAYVYHLYMGLLSGGQILQKKRLLHKNICMNYKEMDNDNGFAVTNFHNISSLKNLLRNTIDEKAKTLDDNMKENLLEESRKVFELNNKIVRTVKGVNQVGLKKVIVLVGFILICIFIYKSVFTHN